MPTNIGNTPNLDAQFATIFEDLYTSKGSPAELDEAFVGAYFSAIADHENDNDNEEALQRPHAANARLSSRRANLKDVLIPSKNKRFTASELAVVASSVGFSQTFRNANGPAKYTMNNVKGGFILITIRNSALVVYISALPKRIQAEKGRGKWESM